MAVASPKYRKNLSYVLKKNSTQWVIYFVQDVILTTSSDYFFAVSGPNLRPNLGSNLRTITSLPDHAKTDPKEILHQY